MTFVDIQIKFFPKTMGLISSIEASIDSFLVKIQNEGNEVPFLFSRFLYSIVSNNRWIFSIKVLINRVLLLESHWTLNLKFVHSFETLMGNKN